MKPSKAASISSISSVKAPIQENLSWLWQNWAPFCKVLLPVSWQPKVLHATECQENPANCPMNSLQFTPTSLDSSYTQAAGSTDTSSGCAPLGVWESRPQHDRVHHIGAIGLKEDSAETGDGEEDLFAEQKTKHSAWMCTGVVHVFSMFCKGCFFHRYRLRSCFRIKATS